VSFFLTYHKKQYIQRSILSLLRSGIDCVSPTMQAPKTRLRAFTSKANKMNIWLLLFSSLLGDSSAFSDIRLHPSRTPSTVAAPTHQTRSYQQRHNPQRHNALSYPIGGPSFEQNKSWEELLTQVPKSTVDHDHITTFDKIIITASVGLAASAVYAMITLSSGSWRYFVAGGVCAATSHAIPTPIDVVKVSKNFTGFILHVAISYSMRF
jgi:hypothetical protein